MSFEYFHQSYPLNWWEQWITESSLSSDMVVLVYSRTNNCSAIWRLSIRSMLSSKHSWMAFSSEASFLTCRTYCDTGPRFIRCQSKDRHPRPTAGLRSTTQESSDLCAAALTSDMIELLKTMIQLMRKNLIIAPIYNDQLNECAHRSTELMNAIINPLLLNI